jgi:hypothetical protein
MAVNLNAVHRGYDRAQLAQAILTLILSLFLQSAAGEINMRMWDIFVCGCFESKRTSLVLKRRALMVLVRPDHSSIGYTMNDQSCCVIDKLHILTCRLSTIAGLFIHTASELRQ